MVHAATSLQERLNESHPTLKFELEIPNENNALPLLDVRLTVTEEGTIHHVWHTKSANRGIQIHHSSHVPDAVKRNMIKSEFRRVTALSSSQDAKITVPNILSDRLLRNGYPLSQVKKHRAQSLPLQPPPPDPVTYISLHFESEEFSRQVRKAIQHSGLNIGLRFSPTTQLRHILKPNLYTKTCMKRTCPIAIPQHCLTRFVVYQLDCVLCGDSYIGSTSRTWHERPIEHQRASRNPTSYKNSAIATHFLKKHPSHTQSSPSAPPSLLRYQIIQRYRRELDSHIGEATHITSKQPAMNLKCESDSVYLMLV